MEAIAYTALTIAVVIGAPAVYIRVCHYRQTHRAVRLMRQCGRFLSRADFEQRIAKSSGTVIFEYPTLGWRVMRVWWTPDDVLALADSAGISKESPTPNAAEPSPFEIWCNDTYTNEQSGRAFLVPIYIFGSAYSRFPQSLGTRFPAMNSISVRSAFVELTRDNVPN